MPWTCSICGKEHADAPTCFGIDAPWRALVPEEEFAARVELSNDQCVVDGNTFFVRGHIEIPILGHSETLVFSVWSSLSEKSFVHICERWNAHDREHDEPYFGWMCSPIPAYPETIHLKLSVQSRAPGIVPAFTVEPTEHPLAQDQHHGITAARWHELVHLLGHG